MSLRVALARNPVLTASAAVAVAAAVCFGTLGLAAPSNALTNDDGGATVCAPLHDDGRVAIGMSMVRNTTDATLWVTGAGLVDADGLHLAGLALAASPEDAGVGFGYDELGLAPIDEPLPVAAGDEVIVVAGLEGVGRAEGVRIAYAVPGRLGEATVSTWLTMVTVPAGETCDSVL